MKGYPIGTFLFWTIKGKEVQNGHFNYFISEYESAAQRKRLNIPRGRQVQVPESSLDKSYYAVLDGQQRITALYLGIMGCVTEPVKPGRGKPYESKDVKFLCLDMLNPLTKTAVQSEESETEVDYPFKFISGGNWPIDKIVTLDDVKNFQFDPQKSDIDRVSWTLNEDGLKVPHFWMRVSDILLSGRTASAVGRHVREQMRKQLNANQLFEDDDFKKSGDYTTKQYSAMDEQVDTAEDMVSQLLTDLYRNGENITFFENIGKSLPEVVDIFVRVNSGGMVLQASDLMLAIAYSKSGQDIHSKINEARSKILEPFGQTQRENDFFKLDNDFFITTGLMLTEAPSLALGKKDNWNVTRMTEIFDDQWDEICNAVRTALEYVENYLGILPKWLKSSYVYVLAYYFYRAGMSCNATSPDKKYKAVTNQNFAYISQWIVRAKMNNWFDQHVRKTLENVRAIIKANVNTESDVFPLEALMKASEEGKIDSLFLQGDSLDKILTLPKEDGRVLLLFTALHGGRFDTSSSPIHIDHIWAKALFTKKKMENAGWPVTLTKDDIKNLSKEANQLPNLELLNGNENQSKSAKPFGDWLAEEYPEKDKQDDFLKKHFIPLDAPLDFKEFEKFYNLRKNMLKGVIEKAYPSSFEEIKKRYSL